MPLDQLITDLPGFKVLDIESKGRIRIFVEYKDPVYCPHCHGENLRKKDSFLRKVRHICIGGRLSELCIKAHKFKCLGCRKYFNQRFPGIGRYQRATEPFRKEVFFRHHDGISQITLALRMKMGQATVERWYKNFLQLEDSKIYRGQCPKILGN